MDHLAEIEADGWRVVWVHDLDGEVLMLDGVGIIVADSDLERDEVADAVCPA